jgi:hypothetical protein
MTPDLLIRRYCECARSVWNTYLLDESTDEFTVKRFDEIRRLLFHVLVLAPLERDDDRSVNVLHVASLAGLRSMPVSAARPTARQRVRPMLRRLCSS